MLDPYEARHDSPQEIAVGHVHHESCHDESRRTRKIRRDAHSKMQDLRAEKVARKCNEHARNKGRKPNHVMTKCQMRDAHRTRRRGSKEKRNSKKRGKQKVNRNDKSYKARGEVRGTVKEPWHMYFDGASVKGRTYAGYGAVLKDQDCYLVQESSRYAGRYSMNVMVYAGLIEGLRLAILLKVDHLCCYGDSRLVHNQVSERWKVRDMRLMMLYHAVRELMRWFRSVRFVYISRKKNLHAARLAHEAISLRLEREAHKAESEEDEKQPEKESSELSNVLKKKLKYELNPRPNPKPKLKPPPDRFEEVRALQRRPKLKKNRPH